MVPPTVLYMYLPVSSWGQSCLNCWHVSPIQSSLQKTTHHVVAVGVFFGLISPKMLGLQCSNLCWILLTAWFFRVSLERFWADMVTLWLWIQRVGAAPAVWKPGPTMAEIEETVRDTALSLIGVESLDNDEPLMDAGTLDHEFSRKKHQ